MRWQPADGGNVEVLHAGFLFSCVQRKTKEDLRSEPDYPRRHDLAVQRIMKTVELPDWRAAGFVKFVRQNGRSLSRKRREREFTALTDEEAGKLEDIVRDTFEGVERASDGRSADADAMPEFPGATPKSTLQESRQRKAEAHRLTGKGGKT